MKKVTKAPLVLDVVNIPGVQRSLERLADLLGKIQKALGEYLERERASFPRYVNNCCSYHLATIVVSGVIYFADHQAELPCQCDIANSVVV